MRTMIAVPCMDMVHTDFFRSCIGMTQLGDGIQWTTCQCSIIYEARNTLADIAIREDFDRVLWLDSSVKLGHAGTALFDEELYRTRNRPGGSD